MVGAPGSKTRNPPWDIRAEFLVLRPESSSQSGLLIEKNKEKESNPNGYTILEDADAAEEKPLPEDQGPDCDIHGISNIPKEPADDQAACREYRSRSSKTLERKAREGIQKNWKPCDNQQHSDNPQRGSAQQWWSNMPSTKQPRHITCNDPRSDSEEDSRTQDGTQSPHRAILDGS